MIKPTIFSSEREINGHPYPCNTGSFPNKGSAAIGPAAAAAAEANLSSFLCLLPRRLGRMSGPRTFTRYGNARYEQAFEMNTALWRFANV